jgi:hypothetical protein
MNEEVMKMLMQIVQQQGANRMGEMEAFKKPVGRIAQSPMNRPQFNIMEQEGYTPFMEKRGNRDFMPRGAVAPEAPKGLSAQAGAQGPGIMERIASGFAGLFQPRQQAQGQAKDPFAQPPGMPDLNDGFGGESQSGLDPKLDALRGLSNIYSGMPQGHPLRTGRTGADPFAQPSGMPNLNDDFGGEVANIFQNSPMQPGFSNPPMQDIPQVNLAPNRPASNPPMRQGFSNPPMQDIPSAFAGVPRVQDSPFARFMQSAVTAQPQSLNTPITPQAGEMLQQSTSNARDPQRDLGMRPQAQMPSIDMFVRQLAQAQPQPRLESNFAIPGYVPDMGMGSFAQEPGQYPPTTLDGIMALLMQPSMRNAGPQGLSSRAQPKPQKTSNTSPRKSLGTGLQFLGL